jgi:hypothetical protein
MRNSFAIVPVVLGCALSAPACTLEDTTTTTNRVSSEQRTVSATGDSFIKKGQPNKNFGDDLTLQLKSSGKNRALIGVDASAIDAAMTQAVLLSATLELTIDFTYDNWGSGRAIDAHRLEQSWSELGSTWNCADDTDTSNGSADCDGATEWEMQSGPLPWAAEASDSTVISSGQTGVVTFDVTGDVADMVAGGDAFGWIVKKTDEGQSGRILFASRESVSPPRLILEVEPTCEGETEPSIVHSGLDRPNHVGHYDGELFWSGDDAMYQGLASGAGSVTTLASNTTGKLVADDSHVYWADESADEVLRAPIGGGATEVVASATSNLPSVYVDDTHVYWSESGSNPGQATSVVKRAPKSGGATETFDTGIKGVWQMRGDGTHLYYTSYFGGDVFRKLLTNTTVRETVVHVGGNATYVELDAAHVYFTTIASAGQNAGSAKVMRIDKNGTGSLTTYADYGSSGSGNPFGLVVDSQHAYWARSGGEVLRKAVDDSGSIESMGAAGEPTADLAIDELYVYWTEYTNDRIMRACKAP